MADLRYIDEPTEQVQHEWRLTKRARALAAVFERASLDWPCHAAVLWIVLVCFHKTGTKYDATYQPLQTTAELISFDSTGRFQLELQSTITQVDIRRASLAIQLYVHHSSSLGPEYCAAGGPGWGYELIIGSAVTETAEVVIPICSSAEEYVLSLPLQKVPRLYPYDSYVTHIRSAIQHAGPVLDADWQTFRTGMQESVQGGPVVAWSGTWSAADLEVSIQQQAKSQAQMLLASAWEAADSTASVFGSAVPEQLKSNLYGPKSSVVYRLELTRSFWCRIAYLSAAVLQVVAVGYCLTLLAGQALCAVVMQQILCNRAHSVWEST